jgi:hypothetical protein
VQADHSARELNGVASLGASRKEVPSREAGAPLVDGERSHAAIFGGS